MVRYGKARFGLVGWSEAWFGEVRYGIEAWLGRGSLLSRKNNGR